MRSSITHTRRRVLGATAATMATGLIGLADPLSSTSAHGEHLMPEPVTPSRRPGLLKSIAHRLPGRSVDLPEEGALAPFDGATGWLNTDPLTPEGLRGRVVLVDFWTYTCINWLRTLPYVRAWAAKYADAGLTVVGVHTPEFGFEHDVDNVIAQASALDVPIRSRSTTTTRSGAPSRTTTGRPSTSRISTARFGITTLARANTRRPRW